MALADAEYLGDGRPDGSVFGRTASELISFHGVTPTAQGTTFASITTTAPTVTAFGFTQAQATAILTNLNAVVALLKTKGLMASS